MNTPVTIREARDAPDLVVVGELVDEYESWLVASGMIPAREANECRDGHASAAYQGVGGCVLLAESDGKAAGCVALRPLARTGACEMKRLYVRSDFRAAGAGRLLVTEIIGRARSRGFDTLCLDTLPAMTAAIRLYQDLGFRARGPYHDEHPAGALYFELSLKA